MQIAPAIVDALSGDPAISFILDRQLDIVYVNAAWVASAHLDGAVPAAPEQLLGRPYLSFVVGPLHDHLKRKLQATLAPSTSARGLLLTSECNTPTHFRTLTSHLVPLRSADPEGEPVGLVVMHSIHVNGLLSERERLAEEGSDAWRDANGTLLQCSCCRRVKDPHLGVWRMSAALVAEQAPHTSHGLCEACLEAYYPED
jgi:hypothetical protein